MFSKMFSASIALVATLIIVSKLFGAVAAIYENQYQFARYYGFNPALMDIVIMGLSILALVIFFTLPYWLYRMILKHLFRNSSTHKR